MRKHILWFLLLAELLLTRETNAASLELGAIRLERMSSGSNPLPILVTVKTSTNEIESGVRVTVGKNWNVTNLSLKTKTSTKDLPDGVLPWPGIGGHGTVSDQTIDFSGHDLDKGITYGFYIVDGIGVNPSSGDGADYKWRIQTVAGGNIGEESELKVPIVDSDQITITGKVGVISSDFRLDLTASSSADLQQGEEREYQIAYGSYLKSVVRPLKVVAEWTKGTIDGQAVPTLDILEYVPGSSTLAHAGAVPVIDVLNRRIEWTIDNFPPENTDNVVRFKLKANDSYSGGNKVNFTVKAWLYGSNVVSMSESLSGSYKYLQSIIPTTQASQGSVGNSSEGAKNLAASPTPTPMSSKISKVEVVRLTDGMVTLSVDSNVKPEKIKIKYGKTIGGLNESLTSINKVTSQTLSIDDLQPDKDYYFKVELTDDSGKVVGSETYTFRTADTSDIATVDKDDLILTVENNVILDTNDKDEKKETAAAVVITEQNCSFKFKVKNPEKVKQIQLFIRDTRVLGASTAYAMESGQTQFGLIESDGGNYLGHIMSPEKEGIYEIVVRVVGFNGSVSEEKIGILEVVSPLTVVTDKDAGLEGAKVTLLKKTLNDTYELISPSSLGIKNPAYTDESGKVRLTLPKGNYRAEISLVGYADRTVDFSIGTGGDNKMPKIVMNRKGVSLTKFVGYYQDSATDLWTLAKEFGRQLISSVRFFKLAMILQIMLGVTLCWSFYKNYQKKPQQDSSLWATGIKKFLFSVVLALLVFLLILDILFGFKFGMAVVIWVVLAMINLGLFISLVNI